jgi:hypothetical protein
MLTDRTSKPESQNVSSKPGAVPSIRKGAIDMAPVCVPQRAITAVSYDLRPATASMGE